IRPRIPYQDVSTENGARVMMRWPFASRKANASQTSDASPARRTQKPAILHCFRLASEADDGGENEQKATIAERYISTHHHSPGQPSAAVSGVSWTIKMPMNSSDRVRTATCPRVFKNGSPFAIRPPSAKGTDIPAMNRKAGKTKSTNVIPLPLG